MSDRIKWNVASKTKPVDGQLCLVCGAVSDDECVARKIEFATYTYRCLGDFWIMKENDAQVHYDSITYWLSVPVVTNAMVAMIHHPYDEPGDDVKRLKASWCSTSTTIEKALGDVSRCKEEAESVIQLCEDNALQINGMVGNAEVLLARLNGDVGNNDVGRT